MCDKSDLGGMIDSSNLGRPGVFFYDRYPGGLGFCEQGYARLDELARESLRHLLACDCQEGCPSCVGLAIQRPAQQQDLDPGHARGIPSKTAARLMLEAWVEPS
jgi:DEAD/DEAH box helicase domain-containing protein